MTSNVPDLSIIQSLLGVRAPRAAPREGAAEAAVAVVLAQPASSPELLLIRRAERLGDPWSGQMGLPGGRRQVEDPDLLSTAIRETMEETAIDLTGARVLGRLDDLTPLTPTLPQVMVRPFVFGIADRPQIRHNVEVAAHRWVPLGDLRGSEGVTTVQAGGVSLTVHAYQLGTDIVWGMTHRILTPLVDLLDASQ